MHKPQTEIIEMVNLNKVCSYIDHLHNKNDGTTYDIIFDKLFHQELMRSHIQLSEIEYWRKWETSPLLDVMEQINEEFKLTDYTFLTHLA